jgi:RimJ/RimL family protein N-acetyltransferase
MLRMRDVVITDRLRLRELELDDCDALLEVLGDSVAMRYYPAPFDRDGVAAWIEWARLSYRENGFGLWAVIRRSDGRFLGDCGPMLQPVEEQLIPEVGYHIVPPEQGRGYATEAARVAWVFANTRYDVVCSLVSPDNAPSRAVAREGPRRHARVHVGQVRQGDVPLLDRAPGLGSLTPLGVRRSYWSAKVWRYPCRRCFASADGWEHLRGPLPSHKSPPGRPPSHRGSSEIGHDRDTAERVEPVDFGLVWDVGAPTPHLIQAEHRAFLAFYLSEPDPTWDGTWVREDSPRRGYASAEVLGSPWIGEWEEANRVHDYHSPKQFADYRHFILQFHDSTFECVAKGFISYRTRLSMPSLLAELARRRE